jgi:hypothetical protein
MKGIMRCSFTDIEEDASGLAVFLSAGDEVEVYSIVNYCTGQECCESLIEFSHPETGRCKAWAYMSIFEDYQKFFHMEEKRI